MTHKKEVCTLCQSTPAIWVVKNKFFCREHKAEAYKTAADVVANKWVSFKEIENR